MNGLSIASEAMVYTEPDTAWRILGPWEYGNATGILSSSAAITAETTRSTLTGAPANDGRIGGDLLNASPGLFGEPVNRRMEMN
jgi:hypothetical protein